MPWRIKANLERNTYSDAERAALINEVVKLEGIVRKGESGKKSESGKRQKVEKSSTLTGRGNVSPATQLAERFGYSKPTMQSRFKDWASQTGYQGPMSSVEVILN